MIVVAALPKNFGSTHRDAQLAMVKTAEYYGLPLEEIEDRIWAKLDKVLYASSATEAQVLAKKAWDSLFLCLMVHWGNGHISGPPTMENMYKKAQQAESLAKFHTSKGNDETAAKQRIKAEEYRQCIANLGGRNSEVPWAGLI